MSFASLVETGQTSLFVITTRGEIWYTTNLLDEWLPFRLPEQVFQYGYRLVHTLFLGASGTLYLVHAGVWRTVT
jgi:hypothetical protein